MDASPVDVHARRLGSPRLPVGYWLLLVLTLGAGFGSIGVVAFRSLKAPPPEADIAEGARRILLRGNGAPLSESLAAILKQAQTYAEPTQPNALLGRPAPDFTAVDSDGKPFHLSDVMRRGPVVLVFYYGYFCDHCVVQLFGLNDDLKYFHELGAEIVAVSPDPPESTRIQFARYKAKGGEFRFPVVSDPNNAVAEAYGIFTPYRPGRAESSLHGTFLIDRTGVVRWANADVVPFTNNRGLLVELARLQGRTPSARQP